MNICFISKYPPIEGGVSAETYWLAKALGERGHKISIVTNSWEVEEDYREEVSKEELTYLEPKNVTLYSSINDFIPPILRSQYYTEKLINLSVDVIRSNDIQVLYSHYMIPYGVVGFVAKKITKTPHVFRHAGSDMGRLYRSKFLRTVFLEVLKDADKVICGRDMFRLFEENHLDLGKCSRTDRSVNPEYFNPDVKAFDLLGYTKSTDVSVFTYFGKISEMKKTYAFVDAASKIKNKKFLLVFVTGNGGRVREFKKYVSSVGLMDKCVFLPFQPPWKIPSIMRASTCVVSPESEESSDLQKGSHYPKVIAEAMACGKCAIMGEGVAKKGIYADLMPEKNILVVNPHDINEFKNKMEYIIDNPTIVDDIGKNAYKFSKENEHFDKYVSYIEGIIRSVI